jgi:hypothetical protein
MAGQIEVSSWREIGEAFSLTEMRGYMGGYRVLTGVILVPTATV